MSVADDVLVETSMRGLARVVVVARHYPGLLAARTLDALGLQVTVVLPPQGHVLAESSALDAALLPPSIETEFLDITTPTGRARVDTIFRGSDAILCAISRPAADKLGLRAEALRERGIDAGLIYLRGTPPGIDDRCGHDIGYQVASGVGELTGRAAVGELPIADVLMASGAVIGALLAVVEKVSGRPPATRETTAYGALRWAMTFAIERDDDGVPRLPSRDPGYGAYCTSDGSIALGIWGDDGLWSTLCTTVGLAEYASMDLAHRITNRARIAELLSDKLRQRSNSHWANCFSAAGIPFAVSGPAPHNINDVVATPVGTLRDSESTRPQPPASAFDDSQETG